MIYLGIGIVCVPQLGDLVTDDTCMADLLMISFYPNCGFFLSFWSSVQISYVKAMKICSRGT